MTPNLPKTRRLRRAIRNIAFVVLGLVALSLTALPRIEGYMLTQTALREEATLSLARESLRGALSRSEALPGLLAERPILTELLHDPDNQGLLPFGNEQLRQSALTLEVADIWVMDRTGMTIASSNYRREDSFIGRRFDFRPYFIDALEQGRGRFHALGVTSGQRGYFFAAPIIDNTEVLGVVAVKILLGNFEETWAESDNTIIVTDANGIIFLSDRPEWHFHTMGPLSETAMAGIEATRQYPLDELVPLDIDRRALTEDHDILTISDNGETRDFVSNTGLIAAAGWRVSVLTPTGPSIVQARQTMALIILGVLFAGVVVLLFLQRRARLLERLEQQRQNRAMLERRVAERTSDLNAANTQLVQEIEERKATELRLRKTQSELVQAGKLAALGQMSAALSHEFNQPLAAVKAYADNAETFLARGRKDEAKGNIRLISQMADRMASISKHLRNFARRPQDKIGSVPLLSILDDAVQLMAPKMNAAQAELTYQRPDAPIYVNGGQVRLQQVLVNLISNALDAMETQECPQIEISVAQRGNRRSVSVRDTGPGLDDAVLAQIFDPFFTTKIPGKGLGLGLSISYNIVRDFGGTLSAENHPDGGAVFIVDLEAAPAATQDNEGLAAE